MLEWRTLSVLHGRITPFIDAWKFYSSPSNDDLLVTRTVLPHCAGTDKPRCHSVSDMN
jgi:hypothetical protein